MGFLLLKIVIFLVWVFGGALKTMVEVYLTVVATMAIVFVAFRSRISRSHTLRGNAYFNQVNQTSALALSVGLGVGLGLFIKVCIPTQSVETRKIV